MQIVIPLKNARIGDIVKVREDNAWIQYSIYHDNIKILEEHRRIIRIDNHVWPIVLEGLVGLRFNENDLYLIKRKIKKNK